MGADIFVSFGASTGELESAFALAKAESNALSREMNLLARQMQATGASADSDLGRHLSQIASGLAEAKGRVTEASVALREHSSVLKEAGEAAIASSESLSRLGESFTRVAELAGVAFTLDAFKEWISSTLEAAEQTERFAAKLGASTGEVQQIGAIATLTGSDFSQMALQLERMQLGLARATKETAPAAAALKALGLSAQEFRQLPIPEQLDTLAEAFSRFADGPTKTAAAMALLGRAGADMIPYLDRGRQGLEELKKAAEDVGVVMSGQDVKALADTKEKSNELSLAVQALGQDITIALNGPIGKSIELLTNLVAGLDRAVKAMSAFATSFGGLGTAIGLTEGGLSLGSNEALLQQASNIPTDALLGGRDVTVNARPKPQVPELQLGGGGGRKSGGGAARTEAKDAFSDEMDDAKQAAKSEEDTLNNLVKEHKISWATWAQDTKAALETEKQAIEAAANQALASAALTSQQKIQIMQKEKDALAEIARQEADAQAKAAEESAKAWDQFFKPLNSAIESQIDGLIKGTESLRTAMAKTAESILESFAKIEANAALNKFESMLTGGASGGGGGGSGGTGGGGSGGSGGLLGGLFSGLLGGAGKAAGGNLFGDLGSLFSGAAAAGAPLQLAGAVGGAASAGGAAAGGAGGIFSMLAPFLPFLAAFDTGAWEIPHDMVANVHAGEMVVPAQGGTADNFRSMLASGSGPGGGDTHVHLNLSAVDGASSRAFLMNNAKHVAGALHAAVRSGDHLGLKSLGGR